MKAADFFHLVAREYDQPPHGAFYQRVAAELLGMIPAGFTADAILEVGAGSGFATGLLRNRFPEAAIVALEPASGMLTRGSSKTVDVEWTRQPLSDFAGRHFDLVTAFMSFHWLEPREQEMLFAHAAGGVLALTLPATGATNGADESGGGGRIINDAENTADGNAAVLELIRFLGGAQCWPRSIRRTAPVESMLRSHFSHVIRRRLVLTEKYASGQEFAESLYTRGVLHALFTSGASEAREMLAGRGKTGFRWDIELLVASDLGAP